MAWRCAAARPAAVLALSVAALAPVASAVREQKGEASGVPFSLLASGALWSGRRAEGEEARRLRGVSRDLLPTVLDLAPFRSRLAVSSDHGPLELMGPGGPTGRFDGHAPRQVMGMRFSPDGDHLVTWGLDGLTIVWDVRSGRQLARRRESLTACARFFPAGDRIVTCAKPGACEIWRIDNGKTLVTLPVRWAYAFEIFPSGDRVFTWGPHDTPAVWDITAGATARRICSLPGFVRSAALFHGEARLGTCNSTDTVSIWDASTCELLREWRHPGLVADIVVPRVGHGVLTLMEAGEAPRQVTMWDPDTDSSRHRLMVPVSASQVDIGTVWLEPFPSDDRVAGLHGDGVVVWNATTAEVLLQVSTYPQWTYGFALSPGGDVMATCGESSVSAWDAKTGEELMQAERTSDVCLLAIGLSTSLDPQGLGRGLSWRQLRGGPAQARSVGVLAGL